MVVVKILGIHLRGFRVFMRCIVQDCKVFLTTIYPLKAVPHYSRVTPQQLAYRASLRIVKFNPTIAS